MSLEQLEADDIYDLAARQHVVRLHAEFPDESLETCYFWYLYHNRDYDAAKSQFVNGTPDLSSHPATGAVTDKISTKSVNLGVFPAEIWQIVCSHLAFKDLSALRSANSALADIAAESMLETVRFDLSFESLERLRSIAGHEHLRKSVKSLTFEAGLLAPIGCIHSYSSHYDLEHHKDYKPQPPPEGESTPQAQRLYTRNLAKFKKEVEVKYAAYRRSYEAQGRLLHGPKGYLFQCIDSFPNIQSITLATDQCRHLLSERFVERYGQDCAVPLIIDPSQTPWELQSILRPGIKRLCARQISPKFFNGESGRSKSWLESIFKDIDHLSLHIRLEGSDGHSITSTLRSPNLSHAIGTATNLTHLIVNFSTVLPVGELKDIIPRGQSFQELYALNIESFTATEEEILGMLKLQPALKSLDLADVTLSTGEWRSLLNSMRHQLHLNFFTTSGVLSDSSTELYTDHFSIEAWQDGEMMSLGVAIDLYVTEGAVPDHVFEDEDDYELCFNPVNRVEDGDFSSYEDLVDELGPIDDSDIEDSDEGDEGDMDIDSDEESMHTANEAMSESHSEPKIDGGNGNDNATDDFDDLPDLEDMPPSRMEVD